MPKPRRALSDLRIGEVALCHEGVHPGAKIVLYKARDPEVPFTKVEGQPGSFTDHFEASRLMEIDSAIDRRLHALLATTTEIMRADVGDREDRVLAAVAEYASTMDRDVPELFAGRLAKALIDQAAKGPPSEDDVHAVVKSQLELAGILPGEPSGGGKMEFLKSLTERGQAALKYILGDRDPTEVFKGIGDDAGKIVGGLLEKAAEWAGKIDGLTTELETAKADLDKAKKAPTDPTSLEAILKAIKDPGLRAYVETQAAGLSKVSGELVKLRKDTRHKELVAKAAGFDCLPNANDELVAALEKADEAGILDPIEKALEAANHQAKLGKAMQELGVETVLGEGGGAMTPDEADQALVAKAAEIRKDDPKVTAEKAYELACERNQDLWVMTRKTVEAGATH